MQQATAAAGDLLRVSNCPFPVRMLLPTSTAGGLLIGKGGQKIRDIGNDCSVKCTIANDTIDIHGSTEHCSHAVVSILTTVLGEERASSEMVVGKSSSNFGSERRSSRRALGRDEDSDSRRHRTISPHAKLEIDEDDMPMDESTTLAAPPVDVGSDDHKALAETPKSTQENPGRITLRLLAPDKLIGRLIGKGGGHIRQIIEETGAHVTVSKDTEIAKRGTPDRTVTIRGHSIAQVGAAENRVSTMLRIGFLMDDMETSAYFSSRRCRQRNELTDVVDKLGDLLDILDTGEVPADAGRTLNKIDQYESSIMRLIDQARTFIHRHSGGAQRGGHLSATFLQDDYRRGGIAGLSVPVHNFQGVSGGYVVPSGFPGRHAFVQAQSLIHAATTASTRMHQVSALGPQMIVYDSSTTSSGWRDASSSSRRSHEYYAPPPTHLVQRTPTRAPHNATSSSLSGGGPSRSSGGGHAGSSLQRPKRARQDY